MSDNDSLPSLEELEKKIDAIEQAQHGSSPKGDASSGASMMMRVSVELLAGIGVGGLIGYSLDSLLGTKPILFVICMFFGIIGGGLNLYRMAMRDIEENNKLSNNDKKD